MAETTSHRMGEGYSGTNKVPTISGLLEQQERNHQESGAAEKERLMKEAKSSSDKNPAAEFKRNTKEREVLDPITGRLVIVKDAQLSDYQDVHFFSPAALDPSKTSTPGPATNLPPPGQGLDSTRHTAPNPVEPTNILLQQFPPPVSMESLNALTAPLKNYALVTVIALGAITILPLFFKGWLSSMVRTMLIVGLGGYVYSAYTITSRKLEKEIERIRLDMAKQRGEKYSPPTPESMEWFNAIASTVWPLINPDLFSGLVDTIEDVMQASLPGLVDAVKIADFTIGKNALRIISVRALPDHPQDKDYPRDEWIDQGNKKARGEKEALDEATSEDQSGDYVNFEISFAYMAPPGTKKIHGENISLMIEFFLGVYDWIHIPIPIWVAVESLVGTVRLRLQMVPQAPFIRNVTFTLMGVPHIEASAVPLIKAFPNVLELANVFVQSSIAAAASAYCAPKSMTINVAQILAGDGIKKDTKCIGILAITIHHAVDLSAQDDNGFSDPYCVLAFAKFGKPLFSTRIITKDLNPVWEQTAYLMVTDDDVRAHENLSIQLWDSDRLSADDLVGRISVPLEELMLKPGETVEREDTLMGFEDADSLTGTLSWSVAYYNKAKLNPALKKSPGVDHSLPAELQKLPELEVKAGTSIDTAEELDVNSTPPDPRYCLGILSVVIHQINNLELKDLSGASGKDREGQAGQDTDDLADQANNLPSAYCEIITNDQMVYKSRVKQYSAMPFFEAGTELVIRDYTKAHVRVVVRDARLREHDPILGIISLPLVDLFSTASQVSGFYALEDGIGYGKVNISFLWKSVEIELPRELSGWDTGTVCIKSHIRVEPVAESSFNFKEAKLVLSTLEASQKVPGADATMEEDGTISWTVDEHIRLPTYDRYASALYFDYGGGFTIGSLGTKVEAFAALWLHDLVDDEPKEVRLPIIVGKNLSTLRQNYISSQTASTHEYEVVGYLIATVELDSGLDEDHEQYATAQKARHEFETYDRIEGQATAAETNSKANDDGIIDKDEQRAIDKAHKKALESRHRGKMQYSAIRTAKWGKDGIKDRLRGLKQKVTGADKVEKTVTTELDS